MDAVISFRAGVARPNRKNGSRRSLENVVPKWPESWACALSGSREAAKGTASETPAGGRAAFAGAASHPWYDANGGSSLR